MDDNVIDKDLGMKKIKEEMARLGKMAAKVGFPDNGDESNGVRIAQYAYWNENGVTTKNPLKKDKLWRIPPRPFMVQAFDNNKALLEKAGASLVRQTADGKVNAVEAAKQYAEGMLNLIKESIKNGRFKENSDIIVV